MRIGKTIAATFRRVFSTEEPDFRKIMRVEGDGTTPQTAFKLIPHDLAQMQTNCAPLIREAWAKQGHEFCEKFEEEWGELAEGIPNAKLVKGVVAEVCKDIFLKEHLAAHPAYSLGPREYLRGTSIQRQPVNFENGRSAILYFDFSAFGSHFDAPSMPRVESKTNGTFFLNVDLLDAPPVLLIGTRRSLEASAAELSAVFLIARSVGWAGPAELFSDDSKEALLLPFRHGLVISADDSFDLSQKLRHSTVSLDETDLALQFKYIDFFAEGECSLSVGEKKLESPPVGEKTATFWLDRGCSLANLGRMEEAINCLDRALAIDPRLMLAWYNKGRALAELGRFEDGINCYEQALAINPQYASAWFNKAIDLAELGRNEEAVRCYGQALAIDPQDLNVWYNKGNALRRLGRNEEAIRCYDQALTIDPQYVMAWFNKAYSETALGRKREAALSYRKFIEFAPPQYSDQIADARRWLVELES